MPFVNEKIPDEDKLKISSVITFEKIKSLTPWVPEFPEPKRWTVDRERNVYLIFLTGGGRDQLPYYVLGVNGQTVIFNVKWGGKGNDTLGIESEWEVSNLRIHSVLKPLKEEIKKLISESLEEVNYFRPFADGGTIDNPNFVARGNILSFNVEFK